MQTTYHTKTLYLGHICKYVLKILKTLKEQRTQLKLGKRFNQIFLKESL